MKRVGLPIVVRRVLTPVEKAYFRKRYGVPKKPKPKVETPTDEKQD
jgi:hypothetical protein